MTTAIALDLNPLRHSLIELLDADTTNLKVAFDGLRLADPDYCGPDPQPHIVAITQRLVDRGIDVQYDNREFDKLGYRPDVWGLTVPGGIMPDFPCTTVLLREGMTPRGTLLTLAHEGGHALTITTLRPGDMLMGILHSMTVGADPEREVGAEMTAYLVSAATGVLSDPTLSAWYILGWLSAALTVGLNAAEVWVRQAAGAQESAATMLGLS